MQHGPATQPLLLTACCKESSCKRAAVCSCPSCGLSASQLADWTQTDTAMLQVLSDVRGIIAEQLGKDLDAVQQDSKFADLGADSLDTVEIMMALEEKFGFEVLLPRSCSCSRAAAHLTAQNLPHLLLGRGTLRQAARLLAALVATHCGPHTSQVKPALLQMNEEGAENISTVQEAADLITAQLAAK